MTRSFVLVDDDRLYLEILEAELREKGYKVYRCSSSEAGLERARNLEDAAFAIDVDLGPVEGKRAGIQLVRMIDVLREEDPSKRFTLSVLSSNGDCEKSAVDAGADVFLQKGDQARTDALRLVLQNEGVRMEDSKRLAGKLKEELACYHYPELRTACEKLGDENQVTEFEVILERIAALVWEALEWPMLVEKERSLLSMMAGIAHKLEHGECDREEGIHQLRTAALALEKLASDDGDATDWLMGDGPELGILRWLPDDLYLDEDPD